MTQRAGISVTVADKEISLCYMNRFCFLSTKLLLFYVKNYIYEYLLNTKYHANSSVCIKPPFCPMIIQVKYISIFRYRNWGLKNSHTFPLSSLILSLFWCLFWRSLSSTLLFKVVVPNSLVFSSTIVSMENLIYAMLSYKFG